MFTLTGAGQLEQDVKKSRFVAWARPVNDEAIESLRTAPRTTPIH